MSDKGCKVYMFQFLCLGNTTNGVGEESGSLWGLSLYSVNTAIADDAFAETEKVTKQLQNEGNHLLYSVQAVNGVRACIVINCPDGLPEDWSDDQVIEDAVFSVSTIMDMERLNNLGSNGGFFSVS